MTHFITNILNRYFLKCQLPSDSILCDMLNTITNFQYNIQAIESKNDEKIIELTPIENIGSIIHMNFNINERHIVQKLSISEVKIK